MILDIMAIRGTQKFRKLCRVVDVGFGSETDITAHASNVRFALVSGPE